MPIKLLAHRDLKYLDNDIFICLGLNLVPIKFLMSFNILYFVMPMSMPLQEEGVLRGQELDNAVLDANYTKAIQIAFELRRPHKLFELFAGLCR